jgi:hypothetical protein
MERQCTWERERPGAPAERTVRREIVWIGDGRVRVDDRVSRETWIVRTDRSAVWSVDHALRTWTETTFEEGSKDRAAVAADIRAALDRAAGSDDEPRLRRWLAAFSPAGEDAKVVEEGDGGAVAGAATKAVTAGPAVRGKVADSPPSLAPLARALGAAGMLPAKVSEALAGRPGSLVAATWTLVFPEGIVKETFEATKIEEAAAPEGTYDVPAGYRKTAWKPLAPASKAKEAPPGGYEGDAPEEEEEPEEEATGEEAGKDE